MKAKELKVDMVNVLRILLLIEMSGMFLDIYTRALKEAMKNDSGKLH